MKEKEVILLTGVGGYIGSALGKRLNQDYQVIGLDRVVPEEKIPGVAYFAVDMTSREAVERALIEIRETFGPRIISVIHLVGYYNFDGKEDERYETITVKGTKLLVELLQALFHTEQFIFSSSMLVYQPVAPGEKLTEDSPLAPGWAYPASKVRTEKMLEKVATKIPVVNLRIAGVYDDDAHQPTLAHQIMRVFEGWITSVPFPGDPDTGQAMLHLDDLASLIPAVISHRREISEFETFVIGEEDVLTYREIQRIAGERLHQRPWPVLRVPVLVASLGARVLERLPFIRAPFIRPWMIPHADEHFALDAHKARSLLGWEPRQSLREKLPLILERLRDNPRRWYGINKIEAPFYRDLREIGAEGERQLWLAGVAVIFLGLFSLANPLGFGLLSPGELAEEMVLGFLVTVVATLSLFPTLRWFRWVNAFLGCAMMFAPLALDTDSEAVYLSDTLIGGLVTTLSAFTPRFRSEVEESALPPGWSYNPSTASQRLPIMFLGFLGFLLSRNLASYQLGHIPAIWEPFFGAGTVTVLNSEISRAFPVSDAGLGAFSYLLDVIAASVGGRSRWKTMPWAVILFGLMIIPTGITSITLVMLQPIGVGAWCTLCLITAFIMLIMVPPAVDEVLASVQFLLRMKKQGESFWRVFWLGSEKKVTARMPEFSPAGHLWPILSCSALGIWLMFAPELLGIEGIAASNLYIVAALVTTVSIIAVSEVARICRLVNVPLSVWLIWSAFSLGEMTELQEWHSVIIALLLTGLSLPPGSRKAAFGSSDRWVHWNPLNPHKNKLPL